MRTATISLGTTHHRFACSAILLLFLLTDALAQTSTFTYQGKLTDNGAPVTGQYDLQFQLFDTPTVGTGTQQGATVVAPNVSVAGGIFTVQLDFGQSVFPGANRFLEIAVKPTNSAVFITLGPRQPITSTAYAVKSLSSASADTALNSNQLGGLGAAGFIQNTTSTQGATNFNISGNGIAGGTLSANVVNAASHIDIGGARVLIVDGFSNSFLGLNAGVSTTTGGFNSFFGNGAGQANTLGCCNSFFGSGAGIANTTGNSNSFFGQSAGGANTSGIMNSFFGIQAGSHNTTGNQNAFFGSNAGANNTTGGLNTFFGDQAGLNNTTASGNAFFGWSAGHENTTGSSNSFFGRDAGLLNTTGASNSFFGTSAGRANTTGFTNSLFGAFAGANNSSGVANSFFGFAAGNANTTGGSNSFFGSGSGNANTTGSENAFFGATAGQQNTTGFNNAFFGYGAGRGNTEGIGNSFFGRDAGRTNTTGGSNAFFGNSAGDANTTGSFNSFFGQQAGVNNVGGISNSFVGWTVGASNTTGSSNSFFGREAGGLNTTGSGNSFIGYRAGGANVSGTQNVTVGQDSNLGADNLSNATAIGANAMVSQSNSLVLGSINGVNGAVADTKVGIGTTTPADKLHVAGIIRVNTLGSAGTATLCRNASNQISSCSSSLRYKSDLAPFTSGLELIKHFRPITFSWKQSGERDLGLAAEEVAPIEPLLVTYNDKKEVEGIKYDRLTIVLINAILQQQAQIDALKKLVCQHVPDAKACN